ncbi:hypothetical protein [Murimonas intestini]|uniref:Hydrolase n=1 Tax=Murimonas intestini TaxID=1337051 RepID=A0AB73T3N6_9FIRM|nr:hypothetical protein [Murimonas intestini]MCR1841570.1 hypothetical protein [Murimonas intestini]MCR1867076.1 hypothetical protein [Murimonas intestini]MCR1884099.1 hypothetical protein [Murimonas intestini]
MRIGETIFDVLYLITVITLGIKMIKSSAPRSQYWLFGLMAVILGCGDAFHLIPRVWAMWGPGLDSNSAAAPLGFGQAVTSVTMTAFYVILFHVWEMRYKVNRNTKLRAAVYGLAVIRIVLCLFPQNDWMSTDAPLSWGIYRNIPFALLGLLVILLFYRKAKECKDVHFRFMWLAVVLSFACYIPVVLFAGTVPAVGALMLPKTCAYVWVVWMGFSAMKKGD